MTETVDLATLAVRAKPEGIDETRQQLAKLGDQAERTEANTGKLATSTQNLIARYLTFATVATTAVSVAVEGVRAYANLETATANLAAKTGLAADQVAYLKDQALALSEASASTAVEILNAAEQIEGLLPALSGNAEAIAYVTKQAVILSDATGDDLTQSVFAVGQAMEQFGGSAQDAARYVNVMVAAAQNGAAETSDLAEAMQRVGPAAARAGVSFEQAAGLLETLANNGVRGREAVGGLKEFLDRLAATTDKSLSPSVIGINNALDALADKNLTAAERTKMFGSSADNTAQTLIDNREQFDALTTKITGTNAALEQARERMDTVEGRAAALKNAFSNLSVEIGDALAPAVTEFSTDLLVVLRTMREFRQTTSDSEKAADDHSESVRRWTAQIVFLWQNAAVAEQALERLVTLDFSGARKEFDDYAKRIEEFRKKLDAAPGESAPAPDGDGAKPPGKPPKPPTPEELAKAARAAAEARERAEAESFQRSMAMLQTFGTDQLAQIRTTGENQVDIEKQLQDGLAEYQLTRSIEIEVDRQERLTEFRREFAATDLVMLLEDFDAREDAINDYFDSMVVPNEEERTNRLLDLHRQREDLIGAVARRGVISRTQFEKLTETQRKEYLRATGEEILGTLAQHNKAAFKLHQAVGIAKAVVSTAQGVTKVLGDYGWPLGPVFATLLAAQGAAQIAAIKSQSFDGGTGGGGAIYGGGGSGAGASVSAPAVGEATQPLTPGLAQGAGQQIQLIIAGNQVIDQHGIERLVDSFRDVIDGKDIKVFGDDSRQAQDIRIFRG